MFILIGAVAILYMIAVGLYVMFAIVASILFGAKINWREL